VGVVDKPSFKKDPNKSLELQILSKKTVFFFNLKKNNLLFNLITLTHLFKIKHNVFFKLLRLLNKKIKKLVESPKKV
jgi:hypothetical protein